MRSPGQSVIVEKSSTASGEPPAPPPTSTASPNTAVAISSTATILHAHAGATRSPKVGLRSAVSTYVVVMVSPLGATSRRSSDPRLLLERGRHQGESDRP